MFDFTTVLILGQTYEIGYRLLTDPPPDSPPGPIVLEVASAHGGRFTFRVLDKPTEDDDSPHPGNSIAA